MQEPRDLYDFTHPETSGVWMIVNDGVMGGISESRLSLDQQGFLVLKEGCHWTMEEVLLQCGRISIDWMRIHMTESSSGSRGMGRDTSLG